MKEKWKIITVCNTHTITISIRTYVLNPQTLFLNKYILKVINW